MSPDFGHYLCPWNPYTSVTIVQPLFCQELIRNCLISSIICYLPMPPTCLATFMPHLMSLDSSHYLSPWNPPTLAAIAPLLFPYSHFMLGHDPTTGSLPWIHSMSLDLPLLRSHYCAQHHPPLAKPCANFTCHRHIPCLILCPTTTCP